MPLTTMRVSKQKGRKVSQKFGCGHQGDHSCPPEDCTEIPCAQLSKSDCKDLSITLHLQTDSEFTRGPLNIFCLTLTPRRCFSKEGYSSGIFLWILRLVEQHPDAKWARSPLFEHQGSHGVDLEARIRQLPAGCSIGAVDPTKSISLYYAKTMQDL